MYENSEEITELFRKAKMLGTFKSVGMGPLLFTTPLVPAMTIFLKGISIGLGAGG